MPRFDRVSQHPGIFQRQTSALSHERQSWVRGIAQQGHVSRKPASRHWPKVQRPKVRGLRAIDQLSLRPMEIGETRAELFNVALLPPAFFAPSAALFHRDDVHQVSAPQRVTDNMCPAAHRQIRRQVVAQWRIARNQCPPRHLTGEGGGDRTVYGTAPGTLAPIRRNDQVGLYRARCDHTIKHNLNTCFLRGADQQCEKIGAVHVPCCTRCRRRNKRHLAPCRPVAHLSPG